MVFQCTVRPPETPPHTYSNNLSPGTVIPIHHVTSDARVRFQRFRPCVSNLHFSSDAVYVGGSNPFSAV